jgi:hypothetical protein
LCGRVEEVREYLREVAELRDFLDAVKGETHLEVVFVNATAAQLARITDPNRFVPNTHAPLFFYLTRQARPAEGLAGLATNLLRGVKRPDLTPRIQVPIFVTPVGLDRAGLPVPVLSPGALNDLPVLRPSGPDGDGNPDTPLRVTPLRVENGVEEALACGPYLLLCASLMVGPGFEGFGKLVVDDMGVAEKLEENLGVSPVPGEPLAAFFRRAWFTTGGSHKGCLLLGTLVFTKWLNLAILARRTEEARKKDPRRELTFTLAQDLGQFLNGVVYADAPDDAPDAALDPHLAAFDGMLDLPRGITVLVGDAGGGPLMLPQAGANPIPPQRSWGLTFPDARQVYEFDVPWKNVFAARLA